MINYRDGELIGGSCHPFICPDNALYVAKEAGRNRMAVYRAAS